MRACVCPCIHAHVHTSVDCAIAHSIADRIVTIDQRCAHASVDCRPKYTYMHTNTHPYIHVYTHTYIRPYIRKQASHRQLIGPTRNAHVCPIVSVCRISTIAPTLRVSSTSRTYALQCDSRIWVRKCVCVCGVTHIACLCDGCLRRFASRPGDTAKADSHPRVWLQDAPRAGAHGHHQRRSRIVLRPDRHSQASVHAQKPSGWHEPKVQSQSLRKFGTRDDPARAARRLQVLSFVLAVRDRNQHDRGAGT